MPAQSEELIERLMSLPERTVRAVNVALAISIAACRQNTDTNAVNSINVTVLQQRTAAVLDVRRESVLVTSWISLPSLDKLYSAQIRNSTLQHSDCCCAVRDTGHRLPAYTSEVQICTLLDNLAQQKTVRLLRSLPAAGGL